MLDRDQDLLLKITFACYILIAIYYGLSTGLTTVTWQAHMRDVLAIGSDYVLKGEPSFNELLSGRQTVKNRLGQLVLEELVPDVADLPLEEVLEIRRKRHSEILAFRDALGQIASDIDPSQDAKTLELVLDTKIQILVKPKVRDLNTSVANLQIDAYNRLFHPTKDVGAALIPVAISLAAKAPMDTTAMFGAGAASALLAKAYEFVVGTRVAKRKVTNASPWSLLFHLQKKYSG